MNSMSRKLVIVAAVLLGLASLYVYARFTVDDAFITWRYGKNLVEHGIWNYSPSTVDPTQAYTNPVFALLSIIPPLLGLDVVLFFKIISVVIYGLFFAWMIKVSNRDWLMVILLFGLPATVVHAFGGLETMLYVFLVSLLLVALHRRRFYNSIGVVILLFVTRPEAWVLVIAVPVYWLFVRPYDATCEREIGVSVRRMTASFFMLFLPLAVYFAWHLVLFGCALPNTFYAKADGVLRVKSAIGLLLFTTPLWLLVLHRLWPLMGVVVALFGGMILSYATSDLQMNYSGRFAFHIFVPAYAFGLYLFSLNEVQSDGKSRERQNSAGKLVPLLARPGVLKFALVILLATFFIYSGKWPAYSATYYQRALSSHAALGKRIKTVAKKYNVKAFSVGDAGMLAYHADVTVLDNVGLASARLTRGKGGDELFELYQLDMAIFYTKNGAPDLEVYRQGNLFRWATSKGMRKVGDLYWQPDYILSVYAKQAMPEISEVCETSRRLNSIQDHEMRWATLPIPPWTYWHE